MRLILFIGQHKVGTSSLQGYLGRNAISLLRRGVLYPAVEAQGFATLLRMAMGDDRPDAQLPVNLREGHNALAFRMIADVTGQPIPPIHAGIPGTDAMLTTVRRQIEVFQPHTVVLAAEVFSNFGAISAVLIARIAAAFADADIVLTATMRRVDDYVMSWHAQRLRFGHVVAPLADGGLEEYHDTIHFDYRLMLEGWITGLPGATLRLRTYDQVLAAGGSVHDFLALHGLPRPSDPGLGPRLNVGLHRGLTEIVRQGNAALDPPDARALLAAMLRVGPQLRLPPSAEVEMLGAAARADMAARFVPIHAWLSGLGRAPFFADADAILRCQPHLQAEVTGEALAQIRDGFRADMPPGALPFVDAMRLGD